MAGGHTLITIACGLFALCIPTAIAIPAYQLMHRYEVANATQRNAVCNDGTPMAYYVRNCTANGDAKPGDPDFCAKGSVEGVARYQWFIAIDDDNEFCWDATTCSSRSAQRKTAATNATVFPDGALLPYPEANPNFYKASAVYIPSCSSDLFLGNTTKDGIAFRGAAILAAILIDLQTRTYFGNISAPLATADDIVISGGPGVMRQAQRLKALLPARANAVFVCDSCLWVETQAFEGSPTSLQESLAAALSAWQSPLVSDWTELLARHLLTLQAMAVVGPLLPQSYLRYQAKGADPNSVVFKQYEAYVQALTLETLTRTNTTFVSHNITTSPAMLDHAQYYYQTMECVNGYGSSFPFALSAFVSTVVNSADEGGFLRCNVTKIS
eukprot:TRINITY_DN4662_c0_g1_i1.p1 TRINITY_DN4662_c0_g1~~TRINITY_DN4662_c0_g1_i1.p1  ORF type:complete len:400 (+),score=52.73 TRINITY_DN4662_c0_g1_i1:49-1200(+)